MNAVAIQAVDSAHSSGAIALLDDLHVELLGVRSRRLHAALVSDGVNGFIDCRVALDADRVIGAVLAAPASYWWGLPARRWPLALECLRARLGRRFGRVARTAPRSAAAHDLSSAGLNLTGGGVPSRTWRRPGEAWRIIFIGTAPGARGRGVAAALYRSIMADRSLVARIAPDNTPSLRLHHGVGWQLYRDGDGVLGVHVQRPGPRLTGIVRTPAVPHPEADPRASGSCRRASVPRSAAW